MKSSGFSLTRPAWALAYGLPRATTSPRAKTPRWRESLPSRPRPEAPRTLASGDPPATQTASVAPEGTVPSGAHSGASKRLIRRALGREAANARITSKKDQNSEAKNVVKQTTPSTHTPTPSEFKQMRSGLLHATKPGRRKFKNHLLCQS